MKLTVAKQDQISTIPNFLAESLSARHQRLPERGFAEKNPNKPRRGR